jgi:hypothetical protein
VEVIVMWNCQQLIGLPIAAVDGQLGRLADLCFDDERWVIRYFIVNTSSRERALTVALGVEALADEIAADASPDAACVDTAPWAKTSSQGSSIGDGGSWPGDEAPRDATAATRTPGTHLQRVEEVRGYHVVGSDGEIGRIDGFLISEASWAIEYIVVASDSGKRVVLVPSWIRDIDRTERRVMLDVSSSLVLGGPEFTDDIQDAYETWLFEHLGRMVLPTAH